eukprot:2549933-Prorocentrum_lima.AAC.1
MRSKASSISSGRQSPVTRTPPSRRGPGAQKLTDSDCCAHSRSFTWHHQEIEGRVVAERGKGSVPVRRT